MSVYAVPPVLAATLPVGAGAAAVASLVTLSRVILLGPIVAVFAFLFRDEEDQPKRLTAGKLVPWFVMGFLLLAALRTIGAINAGLSAHAKDGSRLLTLLAMTGLGVDLRTVRAVGPRVVLTVAGSLSLLFIFRLGCIFLFNPGG